MKKTLIGILTATFFFALTNICTGQGPINIQTYYRKFAGLFKTPGHSLYFFDSTGYSTFLYGEEAGNLRSSLYGYFINDSTLIRPKHLKTKNPSCIRVITNDIKTSRSLIHDSLNYQRNKLIFTEYLLKMDKISVKPYKPFGAEFKVVLFYSNSSKKYFKKLYSKLIVICKENGYSIIVLSLDPVYEML